jgi:hypothetical protein
MPEPDGIFLRVDALPETRGRSGRALLCTVCGATVQALPRLLQLDGRSPAELHQAWHEAATP